MLLNHINMILDEPAIELARKNLGFMHLLNPQKRK